MISAPNSAPGGLCWWPGRIKHDKNGEKWGGGNGEKLDLHLGLAPAAQLEQGSHRSCFLLGFSRCLLGMVESRVPPAGNRGRSGLRLGSGASKNRERGKRDQPGAAQPGAAQLGPHAPNKSLSCPGTARPQLWAGAIPRNSLRECPAQPGQPQNVPEPGVPAPGTGAAPHSCPKIPAGKELLTPKLHRQGELPGLEKNPKIFDLPGFASQELEEV